MSKRTRKQRGKTAKGLQIMEQTDVTAADLLVCMPTGDSPFIDNVECPCADCGITIMHRPHAPAVATKVCLTCAARRMKANPQDASLGATKKTIADLVLAFGETKGRA